MANNGNGNAMQHLHNSFNLQEILKRAIKYLIEGTAVAVAAFFIPKNQPKLEEVLMKHADISLVAVIGVPHNEWGEEIKACIVLKEGADCSKEDIINFAKSNIAAYKYPRIIEFFDSLPLNATGKILKTELRNL